MMLDIAIAILCIVAVGLFVWIFIQIKALNNELNSLEELNKNWIKKKDKELQELVKKDGA